MARVPDSPEVVAIFERLTRHFDDAEPKQMFGKKCLSFGGKAFLAIQGDRVVFKLPEDAVKKALAIEGAKLWDPSGKGRPMREWVAVPAAASFKPMSLANKAYEHLTGGVVK